MPGATARALPPDSSAGFPPDQISHFVDREDDLVALHAQLQKRRRLVIHGFGGIGKTQLAVRYLHRYHDDYPNGRFWLHADQATSLVRDLASLAWRLGLPEREFPEHELQIEAVLRWLREHEFWLLGVDNLDQPVVEAMQRWLPPGLPGHVLITSRAAIGSARLQIDPLPLEMAVSFLLERTGETDRAAARAVAETVGGVPLALEQAAAYMAETGRELTSYAGLLQTRLIELMREGKPDDYPYSVATTWDLSFQRVEREQPTAAALLRLCAFLAPDNISLGILSAAADELPEQLQTALKDQLGLDRAVAPLYRYSLVHRQGETLRLHRLVQAIVRESLPTDQRRLWLGAAIRVLRAAFPPSVSDPTSWELCARLLPHAQVIADLVRNETLEPQATSWLLDRVATYLRARGEFGQARPLYERALAIRERVLGPDHVDTADSLDNLALLLRDQGELAQARPLFERALAIHERVLGPDHPETATSGNYLACTLHRQGELAEARSLFERGLSIRERALGPDHPLTATSLSSLGSLLQDQGDLALARNLCERALAIRERVLGPDHPETANSVRNLAWVLHDQGKLAQARSLFERTLAIRERVLGPDHPETATSLYDLAFLVQQQGEGLQARALYKRALAIRERVLGPNHPYTASSLNSLGSLFQHQGDLEAARPYLERAQAIRERSSAASSPVGTSQRRSDRLL